MEPIPAAARYGSVSRVFTVWFTPNLVPAAFFIGTLVTLSFLKLGFVTSIAAIVVGNLVGAVVVGLLATMGPRTGMAQMPLARLPFGKSIVVPGLLNWLSCIGWDGINSLFGAFALTILIPALPFPVALLIIVICQALLGIVGYEAIHLFEKWGAIALGVMFVILTVAIAGKADTSLVDGFSGLDQVGAFLAMVAIVASFVLAWALYASDYTRYLPESTSTSRVFWLTVLGLVLSAGWLEILGLLVATKATGGESSDTINSVLGGGLLGGLAMVAIAVGTVAVNAMNDYTGSLSLQAAGLRIKRVYSAAIVAVLGFAFTLYLNSGDFAGKFTNFLLFISYWIAPWAGVILADWWLRGRRADVSRVVDFGSLPSGTLALLAGVVGFAVSVPFQNASLGYDIATNYTWLPVNWATVNILHGADIAYYVGFGIAFVIYWVGVKSRAGLPVPVSESTSA
ncbi:MAG: cytosine permease [Chloroflexota bacterium]|nr:cytosine permease [Chloroflexota bacterium]